MAAPIHRFHAMSLAEALSLLTRLSRQACPPQDNRVNGDNLPASASPADALFRPAAAAIEITGAACRPGRADRLTPCKMRLRW